MPGRPGRRRRRLCFASGLAAIGTVLELLDTRPHVVACDDLYGGTYRLFENVRRAQCGPGLQLRRPHRPRRRSARDPPEYAADLVETPTNPLLKLADLQRSRARPRHGMLAVADNTFASPWVQRPLELGFDIVVHSVTKYLNGHSDMIGGMPSVVGARAQHGANSSRSCKTPSAPCRARSTASWSLRGIKTLALRMQRHCENALELADWLERIPRWNGCIYPGLLAPATRTGRGGRWRLRRHGVGRPCGDLAGTRRVLERCGVLAGREPRRRREPDRAPGVMTHASIPPADARRDPASPTDWCASRWESRTSTISRVTCARRSTRSERSRRAGCVGGGRPRRATRRRAERSPVAGRRSPRRGAAVAAARHAAGPRTDGARRGPAAMARARRSWPIGAQGHARGPPRRSPLESC